jgi:hypothetical protein
MADRAISLGPVPLDAQSASRSRPKRLKMPDQPRGKTTKPPNLTSGWTRFEAAGQRHVLFPDDAMF